MTVDDRNILRHLDMFAVASIIIPFTVYLITLAPSVTFFDSGEFITAIASLGSAHSPGYPLFINYAKPFTFLPFGSIAFRVNVATAFSAAMACYGVYLLTSHMLSSETISVSERFSNLVRKVVALSAALTFAFSARLWLQSNHDKPYPLIAFLSAMIFYLLLLWRDHYREGEERPGYVYLGAFLCGLGFGAHQTMVLLIPAYVYLILSCDWRLIGRLKEIVLAFAFGLLGFSVYLHLPIRATRKPLLNWGDPENLTQFLWHFLRKGYPMERPNRGLRLLWAQINAFNLPHEFTVVGLALLFFGMAWFFRRRRDEIIAYLLGIVSFLLVIVGYFDTAQDLIFLTEEFFTPLYLLSAVLIGLGLFALARLVAEKLPNLRIMKACVLLGLVALPVVVCAGNYRENDQHENYIANDYATNTLRSLPQNAVLFTWGDSGAFPLWYLQGVERMREDTVLLHTPHLVFTWYLDGFPGFFRNSVLRTLPLDRMPPEDVLKLAINEQLGVRPVFIDFSTRYSVDFTGYTLQQRGICYRIEKFASVPFFPPEEDVWRLYSDRGLHGELFFRDLDTGKAILIYASSHFEAGQLLLQYGRTAEAVAELRLAAHISPELKWQVSQLLGGGVP